MPPDRWFRQGHPIFVHDSGLFLLGAPRSHSRIWGSHEAGVPVTPGVLSPLGGVTSLIGEMIYGY